MADKIDILKSSLFELKQEINNEAKKFEKEAKWRRRFDISLRAISAILAVAAPALVTYQPDPTSTGFVNSEYFRVLVILLVGFSGASITLQAVFAFDKKYANSKITSVQLMELERKVDFDLKVSDLFDEHETYRNLRNRLEEVAKSRSASLRTYVEEDINTVLSTDARVHDAVDRQNDNNGPPSTTS